MKNITSYLVWMTLQNVYPEHKQKAINLAKVMVRNGYKSEAVEEQFKKMGYLNIKKAWPEPKYTITTRPNFFDKKLKKKFGFHRFVSFFC